MAAGDVDHRLHHLLAVHRAGGVVRVDDHHRVRVLGDLRLEVLEVRHPAVLLVAPVVHRRAPAQRHRARPQGVVRRGHEDLVALVDERLQHHRDELGDAVADEDVLHRRVPQPARLVVLRHGGARLVDPARVAVPLRLRQVVDDVRLDGRRRLEAERRRVADVQLEDAVALGLEALGLDEDGAADVVADAAELLALSDGAHGSIFPPSRRCRHGHSPTTGIRRRRERRWEPTLGSTRRSS